MSGICSTSDLSPQGFNTSHLSLSFFHLVFCNFLLLQHHFLNALVDLLISLEFILIELRSLHGNQKCNKINPSALLESQVCQLHAITLPSWHDTASSPSTQRYGGKSELQYLGRFHDDLVYFVPVETLHTSLVIIEGHSRDKPLHRRRCTSILHRKN